MRSEWESVLKAIKTISDKHDIIDKHTGRRFNVYSIAGMERDEVYTHSRMIAELLNPKGSHGQNGKYLKLFCDQFLESSIAIESQDRATVSVERSVEEGRIDIYVVLPELLLIIENKIDAPDRYRQLECYHSHAKKGSKPHALFYLTLDSHPPSADSLGSLDEEDRSNIRNISYAEDLLPWIKDCLIQSLDLPNVYSGLRQYMNLICKITGNSMNAEQKQEMKSFLFQKPEYLSTAFKLAELCLQPSFRGRILYDFFTNLKKALTTEQKSDLQLFSEIEILPGDLESFQYNERNCVAWCERGNKSKEWERKGVFLKIVGWDNLLLHVEVATESLHYGIVPVAETQDELLEKHLEHSKFELRNWGPKKHWYSIIKDVSASRFSPDTIALMTDQEKIEGFANTIKAEIRMMLNEINGAVPTCQ